MSAKFAIVGCGRIGRRHAEHIATYGKLIAVCDIDTLKAEQLAGQYNAKPYNSLEKMLTLEKDVEVVSICTPNGYHAEQTIWCLRDGKHVVCEKPMALTKSDCQAMIIEAQKANRHLFIVKQNRFNPPVKKLKETIEKGILGQIYSVQLNCFWNRNERYYRESDWKGKKNLDGGTLFTQFSHFIDLLFWFVGDVVNVSAASANYNYENTIDFEDTLVAAIEFENGALGTVNCTINSFQKNMEGSITIFAENGTVKIGGQYLNVLEYQQIKNYQISEIETCRPANDYGYYQGSMSNHDQVILNVINVLRNNGKIATTGLEGMKTVEIIEKIYAQIQQNANIRLHDNVLAAI